MKCGTIRTMEGRMIMQNRRSVTCCEMPGTGIVHGVRQQLCDVYPTQVAIRQGTLFPELDKPMGCAPVPTGCTEPSAQQSAAFAAWEARLYLNTHPGDANALRFFQQLCQQMQRPSYACTFAPCHSGAWHWVEDPWPWEHCANERRA